MAVQLTNFDDPRTGASLANVAYLKIGRPNRWRWDDDAKQLLIPFAVYVSQQARQAGKEPLAQGTLLISANDYDTVVDAMLSRAQTLVKRTYPGNDAADV
jgi:hypothetical protein